MTEDSNSTDSHYTDEQDLKAFQKYAGRLKANIGKLDIVLIFMFITYAVILLYALMANVWAIPGILLSVFMFDYIYAIYQNGKEANYLTATMICETMKQNIRNKKSEEGRAEK